MEQISKEILDARIRRGWEIKAEKMGNKVGRNKAGMLLISKKIEGSNVYNKLNGRR